MSDGRVVIETVLETDGVEKGTGKVKKSLDETAKQTSNVNKETVKFEKEMRKLSQILGSEVPEATKEAYSNIYKMNQEIRSVSRQFGSHSQEAMKARNALNEYALGLDDTTFKQVYMKSQLGLTDAQLNQQANSIKLNARMVKLMGSQTEILTQRMQGLKENGVKPSDLLPASTLGQFKMLSETIAASENPIYRLSAGYRALGTSMEKSIKGWSAQKMAVKMAGDDMVKYGLILRGITAGQASLAMAFPIVGIAAVAAYAKIFSSAMQADEGLQKLAETAKGKLGGAFKPLLDVAGVVAKVFLDMTIKVSDLMIKFNETHPIISKVTAAIGLLLPAMTLLLLPLNMGIGLLAGWKVAINGAWVAVSGIAGAVGLASSTFLAFATIIGTVVGGIIYFWQTNEGFKNAVISAWSAVHAKATEAFSGIATAFSTLAQAFNEGGIQGFLTAGSQIITNLIQGISTGLPQMVAKMNEVRIYILTAIASNLPQILIAGVQIINTLIQGIAQALPLVMTIGIQVITTIIDTIVANLPTLINTGVNVLMTLLDGIIQALPLMINAGVQIILALVSAIAQNLSQIIESAVSIIDTLVNAVTDLLPTILDAGIEILISLIDGIVDTIPKLIKTAVELIETIIETITYNLPKILDAGIEILLAAIDGILKTLPDLIESILEVITTIIKTITDNLPKIIESGVKILTSAIDGIIKTLPQLIQSIITVITTILNTITQNLPKIIEAGVQILISTINGIIQTLPQLIQSIFTVITTIVSTIIENLPKIIEAGIKIIVALIKGLIDAIPQLVGAIPKIVSAIKDTFSAVDWGTIGKNIIDGIGKGLENAKDWLISKAQGIANSIKKTIQSALDIHSPSRWGDKVIGRNTIKGIGNGFEHEAPHLYSNAEDIMNKLKLTVEHETSKTTSGIVAQSTYDTSKGNSQSVINNDNGVTQNVTIVNPERTPSENARALKKVGRDLAYGC